MYQGQLLIAPGNEQSVTVWSPWMQSGGDRAVLTYEVVAVVGTYSLVVEVYTKAREDSGTTATKIVDNGDWGNVTGTDFYTVTIPDDTSPLPQFQDMFRFKITLSSMDPQDPTPVAVILRFLEPTWLNLAGSNS